jgi:hypothetical protein
MIIRQLPATCAQAFHLLRDLPFSPMTREDFDEFAGTEDPDARIARRGNLTVIVDRTEITFMEVDPETCELADCRFTFEGC